MTNLPFAVERKQETRAAHEQSVERAIAFMRDHLDEPLDLDALAKVAFVSKFHLVRIFESVTGTTPHNFLACLRIERAKNLLLTTDRGVAEICFDVGYSSLGSFSDGFKGAVGVCPSRFRALASSSGEVDCLRAIENFIRHQGQGDRLLTGFVEAPEGPTGFIFVGAFSNGAPQGVPDAGTIILGPGPFRIRAPRTSEFYLLAALIPFSGTFFSDPMRLQTSLVGSRRVILAPGDNVCPALSLRKPRITDPPIVVSLFALLSCSRSQR